MTEPRYTIAKDMIETGYYVLDTEDYIIVQWCPALDAARYILGRLLTPEVKGS